MGVDHRLSYAAYLKDGNVVPAGTYVAEAADLSGSNAPDEAVISGGGDAPQGGKKEATVVKEVKESGKQQEEPAAAGPASVHGAVADLISKKVPILVSQGIVTHAMLDGAVALQCRPPPPPAPVAPPPAPSPSPSPSPSPQPTPAPPSASALFVRKPPSLAPTVDIDLDNLSLNTIPESFLGLSHEWPYIEELSNIPSYMSLIKLLSSYGAGPMIIRIGGGSTDHQRFVPGQYVWDSLNRLHKATGAKFILGLNFEAGDAELAKKQMQAAESKLKPGSIVTYEIGNEVRDLGWLWEGRGLLG